MKQNDFLFDVVGVVAAAAALLKSRNYFLIRIFFYRQKKF